ncbi:MAG: FHA domain-containing protein [Phycisphaerae bacterium]|nr:FHA domain-containing protein [Phycisphaerae bacterium]
MPLLIVEHAGKRRSVPLNGKVWIGRNTDCQIIINHPIVSRQHACVEAVGNHLARVIDNNSRNGTLIAGERLSAPRELRDGDIFQVGPATIVFHAEEPGIEVEAPSVDADEITGIIFQCECGARLWAPRGASGSTTNCRRCGRRVKCPGEPPPPPTRHEVCGVCQWKIAPSESSTRCPACGVAYHTDCWNDNKGCAAYGCSQVNVLGEKTAQETQVHSSPQVPPIPTPLEPPVESLPSAIEIPLVAAAVLTSLLGVIAFGVPAFVVSVVATAYLLIRTGRRRYWLATAAGIGLIGGLAGLLASLYWWMQVTPGDLLGR